MDGKKNILSELGLRVEFDDRRKTAEVLDENGNRVGKFPFDISDQPYKNIKTITPTMSEVAPEYQGKGVATEVYKQAEQRFGAKIIPDDEQSLLGNRLHEKSGQGKQFGMSSATLDSQLTNQERRARHSRQRALGELLNEVVEGQHGNGPELMEKFGGQRRNTPAELVDKIRGKTASRNTYSLLANAVQDSWDNVAQQADLNKIKAKIPSLLSRVKSVPVLGSALGAAAAISSGDVSAGVPILGEAESLEPSPEDAIIENPQANPELRKQALQRLMSRK